MPEGKFGGERRALVSLLLLAASACGSPSGNALFEEVGVGGVAPIGGAPMAAAGKAAGGKASGGVPSGGGGSGGAAGGGAPSMAGAPPATPEQCADACAGVGACEGAVCVITCEADNACNELVKCPPGVPCRVECLSPGSCSSGVDCREAESCAIECADDSCAAAVRCGGASCEVLCHEKACTSEVTCDAERCDLRCRGKDSCPGKLACGSRAADCVLECSGEQACQNVIESSAAETHLSCADRNCPAQITCGGQLCQVSCNGVRSCSSGVCCNAPECQLTGVEDTCQ